MAITTWLDEHERKQYSKVTDRDVNELLKEVQSVRKIFLCEHDHQISQGWFRKPKSMKLYTMYIDLDGLEVQVFNWPSDSTWSINEFASKPMVMSFFYGLLSKP
jgi:hypothetical protein